MNDSVTIAVDAMGGDSGLLATIPAALTLLNKLPTLRVVLVGDEQKIRDQITLVLSAHAKEQRPDQSQTISSAAQHIPSRIEIQHASEVIGMDESPSIALRTKKDSSLRVALQLVKDQRADACVSAGNTGALMAISRFVLKTCETIDRPAIISALPTASGQSFMLDLGANVDCHSEQLYQFALMGDVLVRELHGVSAPRIALLNIGEEEIKGNDQVKQANELLQSDPSLNYVGYIEGSDILSGKADVIVCDGFVGNVALKSIEGSAALIVKMLAETFQKNWYTKIIGKLAAPILRRFFQRLDPSAHNGASLVGLRGVVIKSHGGANASEFISAMELAVSEVQKNIPLLIEKSL